MRENERKLSMNPPADERASPQLPPPEDEGEKTPVPAGSGGSKGEFSFGEFSL